MKGFDENSYNAYFGITDEDKPNRSSTIKNGNSISRDYTNNQFLTKDSVKTYTTDNIPYNDTQRYVSENNIDDIDQLGELIRKVLNAAWGGDWGDISPELKVDETYKDILLPQITFDINSREVADGTSVKPKLTDTISEIVNGKKTGDGFNIYRQWFDCIVEFNFWGRNTLEARQLMNRFEGLMGAYSGYLKKQGISEIFFLKEIAPKQSMKYIEGIPMRSLMYYVRLERIQSVRVSMLQKIDIEVSATNTKVLTTEQPNSSDDILKNNNITYKL